VAKVAAEQAEKRELTAARVLEETANVAFSRITDVIKWKDEEGLVDSDQIPDHVAAAIESVEIIKGVDGNVRNKVKFHHKMPALDKLGQNQKLWGSKDDQQQNNNFFAIFVEAARRGDFLEVMRRRGIDTTPPVVRDEDVIEGEA
jgi:Terminase small subunit